MQMACDCLLCTGEAFTRVFLLDYILHTTMNYLWYSHSGVNITVFWSVQGVRSQNTVICDTRIFPKKRAVYVFKIWKSFWTQNWNVLWLEYLCF
jgi:hypothetical protein